MYFRWSLFREQVRYRRKGLRISRSSPTFIAGEHKKGNMSFHHYLNLSLVTRFLVVFLCRCFIPIKMFVYCFMSRITFTSKEGDKKLLSNELNEYNFSRNVHHWSFKCYFSWNTAVGGKSLYNVSKEKRKKENNLPLCQRLVFSSNSDRAWFQSITKSCRR